MYSIYFAGDLFDHKHVTGNLLLAKQIEAVTNGTYRCHLPQNWEHTFDNAVDIRNRDIQSVLSADLILCNFDGTDLDSGTTVEFVIAKMLDIPAVLLRTDLRTGGYLFGADWNLMVDGYPRCGVVKDDALLSYNSLGIEQMHRSLAQNIVRAFEKVISEQSLFASFDEMLTAYQHLIKMCGGGLERLISPASIHNIVAGKIEKGLYPALKKPEQKYTKPCV